MREQDLEGFRRLVGSARDVEAALAAAREDIESIGLAEGDAFIAFELIEEVMADIGDLFDAAAAVVEAGGENADFADVGELLDAYEDELEEFADQLGDCFQYLVFDIEEVLVDMPPLNKERLDDDDAILYSALELGEMTEPWRNVMRLAEAFIELRLRALERTLRDLLRVLRAG